MGIYYAKEKRIDFDRYQESLFLMMKIKLEIIILSIFLFFSSGCYYLSGAINHHQTSSFVIKEFNYLEYLNTHKNQEELIDHVVKDYLADLEKRISEENITLPAITLTEFVDSSVIEKPKDNSLQSSSLNQLKNNDTFELTELVYCLLKRLNLFQSVSLIKSDNSGNGFFVEPEIGVFKERSNSLGSFAFPVIFLSFGTISPISNKEIICVNFRFYSDDTLIAETEGIGGGYTYLSSIWMEDNPRIYSNMHINALGLALRGLIKDMIDKRDLIKKKV